MANVLIEADSMTAIANAIRTKKGVQTTYKPSEMAGAISSIPTGGITPTGTKSITANGTYDVTAFASAEVNVPTSGITPTGTKQISISQNGTTTEDVTNYASAQITVNVQGGSGLGDMLAECRYTGTVVQNNETRNTITIPVDLTSDDNWLLVAKLTKTGVVENDVVTYDDEVTIRNQQIISACIAGKNSRHLFWKNTGSDTITDATLSNANLVVYSSTGVTISNNSANYKFNFAGYYAEYTYGVYYVNNS